MTKKDRDKLSVALRDGFAPKLKLAFETRFKKEIETSWNIFANRLVTTRTDGQPMTDAMSRFIAGFEEAWLAATWIVLNG